MHVMHGAEVEPQPRPASQRSGCRKLDPQLGQRDERRRARQPFAACRDGARHLAEVSSVGSIIAALAPRWPTLPASGEPRCPEPTSGGNVTRATVARSASRVR